MACDWLRHISLTVALMLVSFVVFCIETQAPVLVALKFSVLIGLLKSLVVLLHARFYAWIEKRLVRDSH
mgnify:CR=1 FL=1|jgi:hypothetical protein